MADPKKVKQLKDGVFIDTVQPDGCAGNLSSYLTDDQLDSLSWIEGVLNEVIARNTGIKPDIVDKCKTCKDTLLVVVAYAKGIHEGWHSLLQELETYKQRVSDLQSRLDKFELAENRGGEIVFEDRTKEH